MLELRPCLRVMTYNIRHGRGLDRRVDLGRIAAVIEAAAPDVVALQEVDARRQRSGAIHQAEELAVRLGLDVRFAPCIEHGPDEHYGIATLSRLPILATRTVALPHGGGRWSEPRSALVCALRWTAALIDVELCNTHLSLRPGERGEQCAALLAEGLGPELILAGDLNCTPRSACFRALRGVLRVTPTSAASWPARLPILQLDHLLYRGGLAAAAAGVIGTRLSRRASDHLPVLASFHREDAS